MTVRMSNQVVPGVGVSQQIDLRDGQRLSVMTRRDGGHDLVVGECSVTLDPDEADTVAELVGSPKLVARLRRLQHGADALQVEQLALPLHSPYSGETLGATRIRGRTGASIVAVLRDGATQPSPKPDYLLQAGDLVIAVGTREALDMVGHILDGTG